MTFYSIGDRKITLEYGLLNDSDKDIIIAHKKLFKYCLNNAILKLLLNFKNTVHLYCDLMTIYSTLLKKIPNYDDITTMASVTENKIQSLESKYNDIFGNYGSENIGFTTKWQSRPYETAIKPLTKDILTMTEIGFDKIYKTLYCIEFFFDKFDNLQKLLIPHILLQTKSIQNIIKKAKYFIDLSTIADSLNSIREINPDIIKQLKKIEKITSGFEKESCLLETGFKTFNMSLEKYTNILLGKAILKRVIDDSDCQLIKRRNICYEAADQVISIPLTETQVTNSKHFLSKYALYVVSLVILIILSIFYRLFRIIYNS